jgi:serine/threonine protein phosphatase PrpC
VLENSMLEAHLMIKASRFMNEKDPHSTAVMLLLQPGRATWAHCGDSRLYRFRDGEPVFRSVDHSYVEHLIATGRLAPEQALTIPIAMSWSPRWAARKIRNSISAKPAT